MRIGIESNMEDNDIDIYINVISTKFHVSFILFFCGGKKQFSTNIWPFYGYLRFIRMRRILIKSQFEKKKRESKNIKTTKKKLHTIIKERKK